MTPLSPSELAALDRYWRAANYLSVGQIYLLDNPLLREPLQPEHVKPRLLGHFGTTPGLNLIYAHLNRAIRERDARCDLRHRPRPRRPGERGAAPTSRGRTASSTRTSGRTSTACGSSSGSSRSPAGSRATSRPRRPARSTRAASSATRSRTHSAPRSTTPTCSSPASSATARPRPGPLAASWHSNKFLNPRRDGAVLPILHLNGYKIANPTVLARIPEDELLALFRGYGWEPMLVTGGFDGEESGPVHERFAAALDDALDAIDAIQARRARERAVPPAGGRCSFFGRRRAGRARGRSTACPSRAPGARTRFRSPTCARTPSTSAARGLAAELPAGGALRRRRPTRARARGAGARGRRADEREPACERRRAPARPRPPRLPRLRRRGARARNDVERGDARARRLPPRRRRRQPGQLPPLRPRRDGVEPARRRLRGDRSGLVGGDAPDRRGPRAGRTRHGDPLRAPLPGLARGLPADRPARPLQLLRGVHPHRRLDVQPAREVAEGDARHPVAPPDRVAQLPAQLARLAAGPQRLLAPGPRLHRPRREQEGRDHPRLPAAGREHAALGRRPLPAEPQLRQRRSSPASSRR